MLNKNYIIGGVIILALIAGVVFWSSNKSSTPDASELEKGVKNLTRESAADMIETYLQIKPTSVYGKTISINKTTGGYRLTGYSNAADIDNLEKEGFVKILPKDNNVYGQQVSFTEKAKPYLRTADGKEGDEYAYMLLAEVVGVEVTGITEPTQGIGGNVRMANYTAKYEATPIGKIIDEKKASEEAKGQMPFMLYDDGWRIVQ